MFRENKSHLQTELFNTTTLMHPRTMAQLKKSWVPIYYEHVFCRIDEKKFAPLYCRDNGSPNKPVNILLSLEFIKHLYDYTDEQLLEQYYFNYQIAYALGQRNLGELYICERTLYDFRRRLYEYTIQHPEEEDLICQQFQGLLDHFIAITKIKTNEQRMDSTAIMPNIKRAGRLALAFDVLKQGVAACPQELLPETLKKVLEPAFKTEVLYRSRSQEAGARLEKLLELQEQLVAWTATLPELASKPELKLVQRFIAEQTTYDPEQKRRVVKENKDIGPDSLQSASDPDATFRKKGHKEQVGYTCNLTETCSEENDVQFLTDYALEKNNKADVEMAAERLPEIKERTGVTDLYTDGGFFGEDTHRKAEELGVKMHYTNLTGRQPAADKIPLTDFNVENHKKVLACPQGQTPTHTFYDEPKGKITAWFDPKTCRECPRREQCPVKIQKKKALLQFNQSALLAAETRKELASGECRRQNTSKRAAIEGTVSAIKRGRGATKLAVRGQVKSALVMGLKCIAHNFQQLKSWFQIKAKEVKEISVKTKMPLQGVSIPI
ncbi:Transposase DDE domain protein [Neomoorella glycerini]|uniref:Transposase DDE domain protein n=1 Tax=Neomoorella glycerini TaxID=55779 RepID=A0A6I5ZVU4_9FIRM|nr:transposase [Moorella glycerini]QGP93936.1 Transposase DDE domain protein [Moorella glycerini]